MYNKQSVKKRVGDRTIKLSRLPKIIAAASVVGRKEAEGNLGEYFDCVVNSERFGEKSWEEAENKMQKYAVSNVLGQIGKDSRDIDLIFGGDLLNQCTGTSFGLLNYEIPFFGLYGACSTMSEGLSLASMAVDGGYAEKAIAVTSSHFCSSERQFRFPLEYGGQRTPTSQSTVTGAGAVIVSDEGSDIAITYLTPGKIVDFGINDANNMGAAMAPAAVDTISSHFKDRKIDASYYDLIITGDLGVVGYTVAKEQMKICGLDFGEKYIDCGVMIYDSKKQDTHSGGSGCGCCASVFSGYVYKMLKKGILNRILLTATGALMSPTTSYQGKSIPGIAHCVAIERI